MTEKEKEIHNEAAKLCEELRGLMKRLDEENKSNDTDYCDNQFNELESKYNVEAVIYVIENCFKPFKVVTDNNGEHTIRPMVWYNIVNCKQNTLLSTAMKLNAFLNLSNVTTSPV